MLASLWPPSPVAVYQTVEGRVSRHHDNDQDKDRTTLILVMSHFIVQYLQKSETKQAPGYTHRKADSTKPVARSFQAEIQDQICPRCGGRGVATSQL